MKRFLIFFVLTISMTIWAQPDIQVQGLFEGKAVLNINGSLRMLKEGQTSPEGLELVSATPAVAIVRYQNEEFQLDLSSRISSSFSQAEAREVRLFADSRGHYITPVRINGRSVEVMLDTGATSIAMSSQQADALGISYQSAPESSVSTANGRTSARRITLNSVQMGDITLNSVDAVVIQGTSPEIILLGNSFLSRVDMRNEGSVMVLTAPY